MGGRFRRGCSRYRAMFCKVQQGSLYLALHRLERKGWIAAEWGTSENNRRAKFYALTAAGRKQLEVETDAWERLTAAVGRVLKTA